MDIMKKMNVSLASKLTFQEFQHLYDLGDKVPQGDLVLSMLLSAHSMSAGWTKDLLDFMEQNNVIDATRREELESNPMNDMVTSFMDGAKTVGEELIPHVPDAIERVKELVSDFAERTNIRGMIDQFIPRKEQDVEPEEPTKK
jgi:hypothetical protein